MNIVFVRHGEAVDNVNGLLSSSDARRSVLTDRGRQQVLDSVQNIDNVDRIYTSPLIRTLQTANILLDNIPSTDLVIDQRIREIDWGDHDGKANDLAMDAIRRKQVAGDYFVRFGRSGENKFDIESRLCDFLSGLEKDNPSDSIVAVVSHGTVISFMKRILCLDTKHHKMGETQRFEDIDFSKLREHKERLEQISSGVGSKI